MPALGYDVDTVLDGLHVNGELTQGENIADLGGELIAWSRILDDEEALCIVNGHGAEYRGAQPPDPVGAVAFGMAA